MLKTEVASLLDEGRIAEWSSKVSYKNTLDAEDKEISATMDAWVKDLGAGMDTNHELAAMITKAVSPEVVTAPSELISLLFNESSIGEFDDYRAQVDPKNTIKVYETVRGATVDRSFIDFSALTPVWTQLGCETYISYKDIRRGGYKTVANLVTLFNEALENKRVGTIMNRLYASKLNGAAGYIDGGSTAPTDAAVTELANYLMDVTEGEVPQMIALNKYITAIAKLPICTTYLTDAVKNQYNTTGVVQNAGGCKLTGMSGQKKLPDGSLLMPDKCILGVAGKVGECVTRGEPVVYQDNNNKAERVELKLNGYEFSAIFTDTTKIGKIVLQ
jgi:hypothetical protein